MYFIHHYTWDFVDVKFTSTFLPSPNVECTSSMPKVHSKIECQRTYIQNWTDIRNLDKWWTVKSSTLSICISEIYVLAGQIQVRWSIFFAVASQWQMKQQSCLRCWKDRMEMWLILWMDSILIEIYKFDVYWQSGNFGFYSWCKRCKRYHPIVFSKFHLNFSKSNLVEQLLNKYFWPWIQFLIHEFLKMKMNSCF